MDIEDPSGKGKKSLHNGSYIRIMNRGDLKCLKKEIQANA
jgi:hypothetical protein